MLRKMCKILYRLMLMGIVVAAFSVYSTQKRNLYETLFTPRLYYPDIEGDMASNTNIRDLADLDGDANGSIPSAFHRKTNDEIHGEHHWKQIQIFSKDGAGYQIYLLYSYYDNRPALNGQEYVRIFVIIPKEAYIPLKDALFCQLWKSREKSINYPSHNITAEVQGIDGARRLTVNDTIYWNILVSCPIPKTSDTVKYISITQTPLPSLAFYVDVTYPKHPASYDHTYGMCQGNGVLYGELSDTQASWIIEWFEINQLFGISEFNWYNSTVEVGDDIARILNYYRDKGLLKFHQLPPPFKQFSKDDKYVGEIPMKVALNDCLYRNMYRYKYAVVIDIDEIIVPQAHENYDHLFNDIRQKIKPFHGEQPSVSFGSYAFYKTYPTYGNEQNLTLQTYLYTNYNNQGFKKKTFLNPRQCLSAFSHYCLKPLSNDPSFRRRSCATTTAAVHHYRTACVSAENQKLYSVQMCRNLRLEKRANTRMHHFTETLLKRVKSVKRDLDIQDIYSNQI